MRCRRFRDSAGKSRELLVFRNELQLLIEKTDPLVRFCRRRMTLCFPFGIGLPSCIPTIKSTIRFAPAGLLPGTFLMDNPAAGANAAVSPYLSEGQSPGRRWVPPWLCSGKFDFILRAEFVRAKCLSPFFPKLNLVAITEPFAQLINYKWCPDAEGKRR